MKLSIIFYHPKNPLNLSDVASIAAAKRAQLYIIQRPGGVELKNPPPRLRYTVADSLDEVVRMLPSDTFYVVLETYGLRFLHEAEIPVENHIAIVVGAEDYGIPEEAVAVIPEQSRVVARIPGAVQGMSYNVASTVAMAVYEIERRLAASGREARGGSP